MARARRWWVAAAGAGLVLVSCGAGSFDRRAAVDDVMAQSGGRLSRDQAECYVDRVRDELGSSMLDPTFEPSTEQLARLTTIRVDCVGVANIGFGPTIPPGDEPSEGTVVAGLPEKLGDDPVLDTLHRRCGAGDGAACDSLFDQAPVGSEYEAFAATCGGRTQEVRCAERYPTPTSSVTTSAVPSTTAAPTPG